MLEHFQAIIREHHSKLWCRHMKMERALARGEVSEKIQTLLKSSSGEANPTACLAHPPMLHQKLDHPNGEGTVCMRLQNIVPCLQQNEATKGSACQSRTAERPIRMEISKVPSQLDSNLPNALQRKGRCPVDVVSKSGAKHFVSIIAFLVK